MIIIMGRVMRAPYILVSLNTSLIEIVVYTCCIVSRSQTLLFLHAEGKVVSGQLTLNRLFRYLEIIGGVSGSAI